MSRTTRFIILFALSATAALAATPPALVNYEGVLRDQNNNPLTGTYDMVFRFMDAATSGTEILIDQHLAGSAVTVSGGLFSVALGSGTLVDGAGPGTYLSLDAVFRDYSAVWLEVQVGTETLSPRTRFHSSAYALNTTNFNGRPASNFLDTSTTPQFKLGKLDVRNGDPNDFAVDGQNTSVGGIGGKFFGGGVGVVASGLTGVSAGGTNYGGVFQSNNNEGVLTFGGTYGVHGAGVLAGGYFEDSSPGGATATLAGRIAGIGDVFGGYFDSGNSTTGIGIKAYSPNIGLSVFGGNIAGDFRGASASDYAQLLPGVGYYGIATSTAGIGGQFYNWASNTSSIVGYSTYKILGNGTVAFVQNHPDDSSKVIVYVAPEGDEAAVYTRGSGRLMDGMARVTLGETFALVANPDIGLTATVTPRGELIPLAVSEVSPGELVVLGPSGSRAEFDYMVWGLRIGFEEQSVVQPKLRESKIPSMHQHEQFFRDEPTLRKYTALARYEGVDEAIHGKRPLDFSRADKLRDAVGISPYMQPAVAPATDPVLPAGAPAPPGATSPTTGSSVTTEPMRPTIVERGEAAAAHAPKSVLDLFFVEGVIEEGDLVSLAADSPGAVVRSTGPKDTLVIGCAQACDADMAGQVAVATSRIALCRVDASYGAISVGDRLRPSPTVGMAMKADPGVIGTTILGRAIEPLESGSALVRVLLEAR